MPSQKETPSRDSAKDRTYKNKMGKSRRLDNLAQKKINRIGNLRETLMTQKQMAEGVTTPPAEKLINIDLLKTFKEQGFCDTRGLMADKVTPGNENFKAAAIFRTSLLIDSFHDFEAPQLTGFVFEPGQEPELKTNMKNTLLYQYTEDILHLMTLKDVVCPLSDDLSYDNNFVTWSDTSDNIFKTFLTVVKNQLSHYLQMEVTSTQIYDKEYPTERNEFGGVGGPFKGVLLEKKPNNSTVKWYVGGDPETGVKDAEWALTPMLARRVHFLRDVDPDQTDTTQYKLKHPQEGLAKPDPDLYIYLNPFKYFKDPHIFSTYHRSGNTTEDHFLKSIPSLRDLYIEQLVDHSFPDEILSDPGKSRADSGKSRADSIDLKDSYNSYIFVIMHIINRYVEENNTKDDKQMKSMLQAAKKMEQMQAQAQSGSTRTRRAQVLVPVSPPSQMDTGQGGGNSSRSAPDKNMGDLDLILKCLGAKRYEPKQEGLGGIHPVEMNEIIKILCLKRSKTGNETDCLTEFEKRVSASGSCESISLYDVDSTTKKIKLFVDAAGKNRCQGYLAKTLQIVQSIYEPSHEPLATAKEFTIQKTLASHYDAAKKGNIENVLGSTMTIWGTASAATKVDFGGAISFGQGHPPASFITNVRNPTQTDINLKFAISIANNSLLQLHYEWDGTWQDESQNKTTRQPVILVIDEWFGQMMKCSGTDGELNSAIKRYYASDEEMKDRFCELLKKTMGDFGQVLYYYLSCQEDEDTLVLFHTLDRFCAGIASLFGKGVICEQHGDACRVDENREIISSFNNTFYITHAQQKFLADTSWRDTFLASPISTCVKADFDTLRAHMQKWRVIAIQMAKENYKCLENLEKKVKQILEIQNKVETYELTTENKDDFKAMMNKIKAPSYSADGSVAADGQSEYDDRNVSLDREMREQNNSDEQGDSAMAQQGESKNIRHGGAKSKTRKKQRKQQSNRRKQPYKRRSIKSKRRIKKRTLKNRRR